MNPCSYFARNLRCADHFALTLSHGASHSVRALASDNTMRISGPQPAATAATRAGDDAFFLQARLACISVATVCFAAAAGLEGQKLGSPLVAALPGVVSAGALAYRARPVLALSPPMTLDGDVEIREAPGNCLLYTSPSPRDGLLSRMPSSA